MYTHLNSRYTFYMDFDKYCAHLEEKLSPALAVFRVRYLTLYVSVMTAADRKNHGRPMFLFLPCK